MCREHTVDTNMKVVLDGVRTKKWSPAPETGMVEDPKDTVPPPGVIRRFQVEDSNMVLT
jgi:hypothetical protein